MKKLFRKIKLVILANIAYYEISYGSQQFWYELYSKEQRKAIALKMADEYLNFKSGRP